MASKEPPKSKKPLLQIDGKAYSCDKDIDSEDESDTVLAKIPDAWSSQPTVPDNSIPVQQIMDINRRLVNQIDILKLKVQIDDNKRETNKKDFLDTSNQQLKTKELEVEHLKSHLKQKEESVKSLTEENQRKHTEIVRLQKYVDDLKEDVQASKNYADDIQRHLDILQTPMKLEAAYAEQDIEIGKLRTEVGNLKKHLTTLEEELSKAKDKITQQGSNIRIMEVERENIQVKFKDDLAKVTQIVRNEIEKSREIMNKQYKEMRELRKQSEGIRQDIGEIKKMFSVNRFSQTGQVSISDPINLQSSTPVFPLLNQDKKQIVRDKNKKNK